MAVFNKTGVLPFQKSGRIDDLSRGRVKLAILSPCPLQEGNVGPNYFKEVESGNGYRRNGLTLNGKKTIWKASGSVGPFRYMVASVPWCDRVSQIIATFEKMGPDGKNGLDDILVRCGCADTLEEEGHVVEALSIRRKDCGNVIGWWDYGGNVRLLAGETFSAEGIKIEIG